jgi:hypothetical protein
MVKELETIDTKQIKNLAALAGIIISLLALLSGSFTWVDSTFVRKDLFAEHKEQNIDWNIEQEDKIAELIRIIEEDRIRSENELRKMIKDSSALGIVIRRDFLLSRDKDTLTPSEQAELNFLNHKLRQLNIER